MENHSAVSALNKSESFALWVLEDDLKATYPLVWKANPMRRDAVKFVRADLAYRPEVDVKRLAREAAGKIVRSSHVRYSEEFDRSASIIESVFAAAHCYKSTENLAAPDDDEPRARCEACDLLASSPSHDAGMCLCAQMHRGFPRSLLLKTFDLKRKGS